MGIKRALKAVGRAFLRGLFTVLPIVVTLVLAFWLADVAERLLGPILLLFLPEGTYVPGMGVATGIVLIFLAGVATSAGALRRLFEWLESQILRVPVLKDIYGPMRDLARYFSKGGKSSEFERIVLVDMGRGGPEGGRMLGFVTREDFSSLPPGFQGEDLVAVYLPMSYQIGGFTVYVPRSAISPVAMGMEEAMRFVMTAGVSSPARPGPAQNE